MLNPGSSPTLTERQRDDRRFFRELRIEFLIHELKDPIAVIETGLRMLLEKRQGFGSLTEKQERTLLRSLRAARKARAMLHGLLEVGRAEAGFFCCTEFPLLQALEEVVLECVETMDPSAQEACADGREKHEVLARCGVKVEVETSAEKMVMCQDRAKFSQIVGNLVKNALYHKRSHVEIRARRKGENLEVEVSDDGPGIQPEHRDLIFKRYAQVETPAELARRGHGLGLAGAKILAEALGGRIEVESAMGKGITFRIILPISIKPQVPQRDGGS